MFLQRSTLTLKFFKAKSHFLVLIRPSVVDRMWKSDYKIAIHFLCNPLWTYNPSFGLKVQIPVHTLLSTYIFFQSSSLRKHNKNKRICEISCFLSFEFGNWHEMFSKWIVKPIHFIFGTLQNFFKGTYY